jgi:hypothetical protein
VKSILFLSSGTLNMFCTAVKNFSIFSLKG